MRLANLQTACVTALLTTAGCADAVRSINSQDVNFRTGVLSTFTYAAAPGEMRTVIVGNPFEIPQADLDRIVTSAMDGNHYGPPTTFTTQPGEAARPSYRIVMMFDPPEDMSREQICAPASQLKPQPGGERLGLLSGFCARNDLMSWVAASISRPSSADDPTFRDMIVTGMFNLIPSRDRERESTRFVD